MSSLLPARARGRPPAAPDHTNLPFSQQIRIASQQAHTRAERGFQPFLRDPATHLVAFLQAQLVAHQALIDACPQVHPAAFRVLAGLCRDCGSSGPLRADANLLRNAMTDTLHPLAVAYLIFGGRKGGAVVRRLLQRTRDLAVPSHFDDDPVYDAAWQATLTALDAVDPQTATARTILRDVQTGFTLFERAVAAGTIHTSARTMT